MQSKIPPKKLKPCPFCGGQPAIESAAHEGLEYSSVRCRESIYCPASGGRSPQQSVEQAIEKWNRRTA